MPSVKRTRTGHYLVRGTDHQGKDRRITAPTKLLADELALSIEETKLRVRHGLHVDQPRILFSDYWAEWLTRYKHGSAGRRKPRVRTVESVLEIRRRLDPLNNLWLDSITREELEGLAARIAGEGRQDRAHKALHLARRVLRDAGERGFRVDGRVLQARIAPGVPRVLVPLTWEQVGEVALWMPEHACRSVAFLALTGLRVGEFCALTDGDVFLAVTERGAAGVPERLIGADDVHQAAGGDDPGPRVRIPSPAASRSVTASYLLVRRDTTKTDAGARRVYLSDQAVLLVREQMLARPNVERGVDRQLFGRTAADSRGTVTRPSNVPGPRSTLLFPNEDGNPYNRHSYRALLVRAATHAGIPGVHPHALRATCATLMAQAGIPFEITKEQLGWSDATAARMYGTYRKIAGWEAPKAVRLLDSFIAETHGEEMRA